MTLGKYDIPIGYYCGPSAIMLLTGKEYEEVRSAINKARKAKDNRGVIRLHRIFLIKAVELLGYQVGETLIANGATQLKNYSFKGHWIVETSGHFLAVSDNEVAENQHVWWTPIKECKSAKRRVLRAWQIKDKVSV